MRSGILVCLLAASCVRPTANQCADGRWCPETTTCDDDHGLCLVESQRTACIDHVDGDDCVFESQPGFCDRGVCVASVTDLDHDGVLNEADNCPTSANLDQADRDGDTFGDACDGCPDLGTALNHDEDGDHIGDPCDVCPAFPDFQFDRDLDGVGDECEPLTSGRPTKLLAFDPFVTLGAWTSAGTAWIVREDSFVPVLTLAPGEAGLQNRQILIETSYGWVMELGLASEHVWGSGERDRFGIAVVDAAGNLVSSCEVTCDAVGCSGELRLGTNPPMTFVSLAPQSREKLTLDVYRYQAPPGHLAHCKVGPAVATIQADLSVDSGTPVVVGSPNVALRYLTGWAEPF